MKISSYQGTKSRRLKLETLEERTLMAVWAGIDDASLDVVPVEGVPFPAAALVDDEGDRSSFVSTIVSPDVSTDETPDVTDFPLPLSAQSSEVTAYSPIDIDDDGFIGPGDYSRVSAAWFSDRGKAHWDPDADMDRDGFVGPGDYSLLSQYWFSFVDQFPDQWKEYRIVPNDLTQWEIVGETVSASNGVLTIDARSGAGAAVCPFEFGDAFRLTAEFSTTSQTGGMQCGFQIAVQDSGESYFVEIRDSRVTLFYRDADQNEIELSPLTGMAVRYNVWNSAWLQVKDGHLSFGFGEETLICLNDSRLSGGRVGFYADRGQAAFRGMVVDPSPADVAVTPSKSFVYVTQGGVTDNYAAFPDVCRLADGRLMAVYYVGYSHVSLPNSSHPTGGRVSCSFSSDEGRTWTALQTVVDTPLDDRDPSVVQLSDGRILCNFFTLTHDSNGNVVTNTLTVESRDNGLTWSQPVTVYAGYVTSSPVRILSNGNLIMPLYRQADGTAWGAVGISQDNGKTWSSPITIPRGQYRLDAETDIVELSDGTLYAIEREQMAYSVSKDGGWTWSVSKDVGFFGQSPYLLRTSGGIIVLAQRSPNTSIRISRDECQTWSNSIIVDSFNGAYPSMVELKDGSILIVYYEEGNASNVRAKRFTINSGNSVTWGLL